VKRKQVEVKSDGGNTVSIRVTADKTGTYGGFMYVTHDQATEILKALVGMGFGPVMRGYK
jgi:hypothetical protein